MTVSHSPTLRESRRVVTCRLPGEITAVVGVPEWSGLAWLTGAQHIGEVYARILRRALSIPEGV